MNTADEFTRELLNLHDLTKLPGLIRSRDASLIELCAQEAEASIANDSEGFASIVRRIRALAAPPTGPREPFAWCQGGDCGWRGTVSSLVPKINCRICPLCSSTAIIEVGTPEGLSFEEYDRMDGAAAPPAGVGAEATALKPATWAAVQIGRCPNCDEFPAEWSSVGKPCSECGIELTADSDIAEDGTELWTFDFADQADYDRKHAGSAPAGTGGRRPAVDYPECERCGQSMTHGERNVCNTCTARGTGGRR